MEKHCKTCTHWDAHSIDLELGDCRAPDNHRYWHHHSPNLKIVALLDSFGPEETKPSYSCGAWKSG